MKKTLRPYQSAALDEVSRHFSEGRKRVILCCPTGGGKSLCGANAVLRAVERGKKVLWVAHRSELVDQAAAELASTTGRRIGIIQGSRKPDPSAQIQVATIQTLIRRENIPPADLVVGDEAHRMLAKQWHALLETYSRSYFLYLTATPERGDGKPMSDLADVIVPTVQPSELIDEGVLVPCEIIAPNAEIAKGLAEDPVTAYLQWGGRRRAVFFCQTKEHARRVTASLEDNGIPAGMVTDDTPWATRKAIYKKVHSGQLLALVNVFVATEGLDIPPLEVCVIARTMGHASMYVQAVGRILRASPNKSSGLIIDLKGVVEKYGSPEADRHYHLEGDEAVTLDDKGAAKRMKCPDCGSLRSGPVCPVCGLAFGSDRPPVPDIVSTPLEVKVSIDRTEDAAAEYIRIVHDKFDTKVKNFAREASIAFRQSRNSPPASDWITLYADFLRGHLTPSRRPSWWPSDVEMSLYRRTQHAAAE
jgi:superfamily II DNA or RNA helicase